MQFKKFPYITFAKIAGCGYLRRCIEETDLHLPVAIKTLCLDFYYDETVGVEQCAFKLFRLMKKAKLTSIVKPTASKLIQRYLNLTDSSTADGYFDALVHQKCMVSNAPTQRSEKYILELRSSHSVSNASSYRIAKEKEVEFSRIRSKRSRST